MESIKKYVIGDGIRLNIAKKENDINRIYVFYRTKAHRETASAKAVLAGCMKNGNGKFKNTEEMEKTAVKSGITYWDIYTAVKGDEHILCFVFCFNSEYDMKNVFKFIRYIIFYPDLNEYGFANTETGIFYVKNVIRSLCDDFKIYGKMRFAEEMGRKETLGIRENGFYDEADNVTGAFLKEIYLKIIHSAPCEIYYCGCGQEEFIREYAQKTFTFARHEIENINKTNIFTAENKKAVKERRKQSESIVYFGFVPKYNLGDKSIFSLIIINEILGGQNGVLYSQIREKTGLCYYIKSGLFIFKQVLWAEAAIDKNDFIKISKLMKNVFENIKNGNEIKKHIQSAKNSLKSSVEIVKEDADLYVDFLLNCVVMGMDFSTEKYTEKIDAITENDVLKCAENIELNTIFFLEGEK